MADIKIPEVDIIVDEKAGVIKEVEQPKKLRSKKGHERRVNGTIYTVLTIMSIVWLVPFVFLVLQSFRSYKLEKGGMVDYLIPKTFSLDNYAFLFEGSNFFSWCGKAMLLAAAVALAATLLTHFLGRSLDRADASRGKTTLTLGAAMAVCYAALAIAAGAVHGQALGQRLAPALLGLVLFTAAGVIFARIYLKQDDKLLRALPGYVAEDKHEGAKKVATLAAELWALALLCQCIVAPMQASQYIRWYGNTLTIALFTAVIQTVIVLSVSYALSRLRFRGRKLIMNTVLVLGLFPGFLTMITLYFLLKQMGLTQAGAVPGLILIYCASSGMGYYISKGFFDTIPKSLDESARIDGATRFQVFLKIIMPLAKPIVIYTVLMAFMAPWGDYVFASYVAFGHQEGYNVAVGLYNWVNTNDFQNYFTRFCAGGVLVAVPITALFLALQKYYVEGVTGGAVKG